MTTVSYKNVNIDKIVLAKPVKKDGVYQSTTQFSIQSPEINIDLDNNKFTFTMVKKGKFVSALEEIEEKIINTIYTNSTVFFNGKTFTENKIREAFKKTFTIDNDGIVTITATVSPYLKVYDYFNDIAKPQSGPFTGICIFQLNPIRFVKSEIQASYSLRFVKLPMTKKKSTDCLFDDEPEVKEDVKQEEQQATEEVKEDTVQPEDVKETAEEEPEATEEVKQDVKETVEDVKEDTVHKPTEDVKEEMKVDYTSFFED